MAGVLLLAGTAAAQPTAWPAYGAAKAAVVVLGTVQDAGSPHIGCRKACCEQLRQTPDPSRKVVCLGITDPVERKKYLVEATPDLPQQLRWLGRLEWESEQDVPDAIFLTHAHIGHYSGLMYLGKEALGADAVPVHVMPRMQRFLTDNGPWSQLVADGRIALRPMEADEAVVLSDRLSVVPFQVPHRDEYSETVGFRIIGPERTILFIPDIDKWSRWGLSLPEVLAEVDLALVDATFFDGTELPHRDMSEIPHPFVVETMASLAELPLATRQKVVFLHLNHTNPLLNRDSPAYRQVTDAGFRVAQLFDRYELE
ncbi:MAG: hypothetical protein RLY31_1207 [Bacteroidota bacterium]